MEAEKAKIVSSSAVVSLIIIVVILWLTLGLTTLFFVLACLCFAATLAVFAFVLVQYSNLDRRRRLSMVRRSAREGELRQEYSFLRKVAGLPTRFKYEVLAAATDGFRSMIGRGSSATVFKGILEDGTAVAVKRIDTAEDGGDREFRSEVSAIASVQHVNLVRLLGYCHVPGGLRFLVYDFVHNGSLDQWIFPRRGRRRHLQKDDDEEAAGEEQSQRRCLPWAMRYMAAVDVAKALSYLHHDCRHRILHLDVKPENILLDESFRACVADFGLSKLMGKDQSRVVTTVRGTRGYLAPEWLIDTGVTEKSDVYSYGMVLLELVGGRRNVRIIDEGGEGGGGSGRRWSYFPRIVMEKARQGRLMEVVDERLLPAAGGGGVEEKEVRTVVYVALWCIQEEARLRPSMARVVDMLEGRMPVERPPETEMIIVDLLAMDESGTGGDRQGRLRAHPVDCQRETTTMSVASLAVSALSGR